MAEQQEQSQQAEQRPDLAGYPSVDALVAGYRASSAEAKRWREAAEAKDREAEARWNQPAANPRQDIPSQRTPWESLAEYGVPTDPLRGAISEVVRDVFQPLAQSWQARTQMLSQYPDYAQFEADVAQFIAGNPQLHQTYQRMFSADPSGAMEFALLKFRQNRAGAQAQAPANGDDRARAADAAIPSSRATESRNPDTARDELLARAWKHYKDTGDAGPYSRLRIRSVVTDEHLAE